MTDTDNLTDALVGEDRHDDYSIFAALHRIGTALRNLGNADAATPMGGLEAHGKAMFDIADKISMALHDVADAIRQSK